VGEVLVTRGNADGASEVVVTTELTADSRCGTAATGSIVCGLDG